MFRWLVVLLSVALFVHVSAVVMSNDEWSVAGSNMVISSDRKSVAFPSGSYWRSAYGTQRVSSGVAEWYLLVDYRNYHMMVGVAIDTNRKETHLWDTYEQAFYAHGTTFSYYGRRSSFGSTNVNIFSNGCIIRLVLDLNARTLSMFVDGTYRGAWTNVPTGVNYMLAVSMHEASGAFKILPNDSPSQFVMVNNNDEFATYGLNVQLSNAARTVKQVAGGYTWRSAYGSDRVLSGTASWTLRVDYSYRHNMVGVCSNGERAHTHGGSSGDYMFYNDYFRNCLYGPNNAHSCYDNSKATWVTGDLVRVFLDTDKAEVSLYVNGVFNHKRSVPVGGKNIYRLCVSLHANNEAFTILNAGVNGDPFYTTFDGLKFEYTGTCPLILATDCVGESFKVVSKNSPCGLKSCLESIEVSFGASVVLLDLGPTVFVNGQSISLSELRSSSDSSMLLSGASLSVESLQNPVSGANLLVRLETDFGLRVSWTGFFYGHASVSVDKKTPNVCGLLGNNNQNVADDFQTKSGALIKLHQEELNKREVTSEDKVIEFTNQWIDQPPNVPASWVSQCQMKPQKVLFASGCGGKRVAYGEKVEAMCRKMVGVMMEDDCRQQGVSLEQVTKECTQKACTCHRIGETHQAVLKCVLWALRDVETQCFASKNPRTRGVVPTNLGWSRPEAKDPVMNEKP